MRAHRLRSKLGKVPKKQISGDSLEDGTPRIVSSDRITPIYFSHKKKPFGRGPMWPYLGDENYITMVINHLRYVMGPDPPSSLEVYKKKISPGIYIQLIIPTSLPKFFPNLENHDPIMFSQENGLLVFSTKKKNEKNLATFKNSIIHENGLLVFSTKKIHGGIFSFRR